MVRASTFYYMIMVVLFSTAILSVVLLFVTGFLPSSFMTGMDSWLSVVIFLFNSIFCILSLTSFLNLFKTIRNNQVVSFLTFFYPAIAYYVLTFIYPKPYFGLSLMIPLPFLIPQTLVFIDFRKRLPKDKPDIKQDI